MGILNPKVQFLSYDVIKNMYPILSFHHSIEIIMSVRSVAGNLTTVTLPMARIKSFSPSALFLGYNIEPIGSFSSGAPEWIPVNKNGLNFGDMSFEIEERAVSGKEPILRPLLAIYRLQANNGLTVGASSMSKWGGFKIIIRAWGKVSKNKLVEIRRYELDNNMIIGIDIPSLSSNSAEFIKYNLTISPNACRIFDSYESNLALTNGNIKTISNTNPKTGKDDSITANLETTTFINLGTK